MAAALLARHEARRWIALTALMLMLLAPFTVLVAIAIKLDTRGPVFFTQERVGRGGRRFRLMKFRTMAADAESRRAELLAHSSDPNWLKIDNDPRISRVGRRLRHLSIDELPQLWNVLRGEMSMVGPRPLIPRGRHGAGLGAGAWTSRPPTSSSS